MALFPGLPGWTGTRKVKPIWILLKQETVSGSGISWAICKSAPRSRQITMPVPHHSVFLQAGCSSCRPTNSVEALKAITVAYAFLSIYEKKSISFCQVLKEMHTKENWFLFSASLAPLLFLPFPSFWNQSTLPPNTQTNAQVPIS